MKAARHLDAWRPRLTMAALVAAACAAAPSTHTLAQTQPTPDGVVAEQTAAAPHPDGLPASSAGNDLSVYDFTQVLTIFKDSTSPVRTEMGTAINGFQDAMQKADEAIARGEYESAIDTTIEAIDGLLAQRDQIVEPLLNGQEGMVKQMAPLREAIAKAIADAPAEQLTGIDAMDTRSRDELTQLARQFRDAKTDNAKRLAEQKFRTKLRLAELKHRARGSQEQINLARRRLLERMDQMLAVLGELSVNAEITFTTLDAHGQLFREYRQSLALAKTAEEAEKQLREIFGTAGLGGKLHEVEDTLDQFGTEIDDKLLAVLDSLSSTSQSTYVSSSDQDIAQLMNQLLEESE